jgi:hypothetical protein
MKNLALFKKIKELNVNYGLIFYCTYSALFAFYIFYGPLIHLYGFNISRDVFLGTDGPLKIAIDIRSGRFYPLANLQYILLLDYFNAPVWICLIYRALLFLFFSYLFYIIGLVKRNSLIVFTAFLVLSLSPTFVNNWLEPFTSEVELSVIFIALAFYLEKNNLEKNLDIFIILLLVNTSIYLKEPVFLCYFACVITYLIFDRNKNKRKNLLFTGIFVSSIVYVVLYYLLVYKTFSTLGLERYGSISNNSFILNFLKNFFNYVINDNIAIILMSYIVIMRIKENIYKFNYPNDVILVLTITYLFSYLLLNMYSLNYMLPLYSLVAYLFFRVNFSKYPIIFICIFYCLNAFPLVLNQISNRWYSTVNYHHTFLFLENYLNNNKELTKIYFDGISREPQYREFSEKYDRGIELNIANDLLSRGIKNFDVCSEEKPRQNFNPNGYSSYPISYYSQYEPSKIQSGDIYIISPHSKNAINHKYIEDMHTRYTLLYKTTSFFAIPNYSIKNILKEVLLSHNIEYVITDKNTKRLPEYYIFLKN